MTVSAWSMFDALVMRAPTTNPWTATGGRVVYRPDLPLLGRLLAVPLSRRAISRSGVPAKAIDVWLAHELRRAGFLDDEVWPRASDPRVLPREVSLLVSQLPAAQRAAIEQRLRKGLPGVSSRDARVLGKNYPKQVDVVIAQWQRGAELLVSTKRMDSSFGNNALNRVEESYGDANNLRGRYPLAALGFLFALRSTAFDQAPAVADRIVDLLGKLGREAEAYDATALVVTRYDDGLPVPPEEGEVDTGADLGDGAVSGQVDMSADASSGDDERATDELEAALSDLPHVALPDDRVPAPLRPGAFLQTLIERVLDVTPVELHTEARRRRAAARAPPRDGPATVPLEPA